MSVDELSQSFLKVLLEYGGDADTTTLRSETGMSRGQINHRYRKLNELGWIEIDRAEKGSGDRTPPKIAIITEEGMQAIRSGEAGPKVLGKEIDEEDETLELTREQLDSFHQEIQGMKNQLNIVVQQMNQHKKGDSSFDNKKDDMGDVSSDKINELEQKINTLSETVKLLNESLSQEKKKNEEKYSEIMNVVENSSESDENIDMSEIKSKQENIDEWKNIAELHLKAFRLYIANNGDDINEYLSKAKNN